jgi:hypothetical protein
VRPREKKKKKPHRQPPKLSRPPVMQDPAPALPPNDPSLM